MLEKPIHQEVQPPDSSGGHTRLESLAKDCPSFTADDLSCIGDYLASELGKKECKQIRRGDMLPYLFKLRGAPMSLKDHIQLHALYASEYAADTLILAGRQIGKCGVDFSKLDYWAMRHPTGCRAESPESLISVIAVAAERATASIVDQHMRPGRKNLLRIKTRLGSELFVSPEHRFLQFLGRYTEAKDLKVGSRVCRMRKCYMFGNATSSATRIRMLGYLIGDGYCGSRITKHGLLNITLTAANEEVIEDVRRIDDGFLAAVYPKQGSRAFGMNIHARSTVATMLIESDLALKHSWEKFIPDWVFDLNKDCTTSFIEALWATDGTIMKSKAGLPIIEYNTTSRLLASDLIALLSKYGILTHLRTKATGYKKADGTKIKCRDCYIVRVEGRSSCETFLETFNVPGKPSFKLNDTKSGQEDRSNRDTLPIEVNDLLRELCASEKYRYGRRKGSSLYTKGIRVTLKYPPSAFKVRQVLNAAHELGLDDTPAYRQLKDILEGDIVYDTVTSIEDAGEHDTFDLTVNGTHNYVLDGIVVHNSLNLSRAEILDCLSMPEVQILYVAPLQSQAQRYSTLYLNEAIKSCELARIAQMKALEGVWSDAKILTAVGHQSFANGAGVQLTYAKTSPDRARGIFADIIDFDEVQDQLTDNIPIISQSTKSSKLGIRRFTGTAKTEDNTIEGLWRNSSKCEWLMKCDHCGEWNVPNLEGRVLDMIQADGMHCVYCGGKLNVRNGEWVPTHPEKMRTFRGYHVPQVILPFHTENMDNWGKIVRDVLTLPQPIILQEILGISCSQGQRIIDQTIIDRQSDLPTMYELQDELHRYAFTVGGLDWGGAEQVSFTVHTILGVKSDGTVDVLWARRYQGYDPDEVLSEIAQTHSFYKCRVLAADYGLGFDKNVMLTSRFGLPVVQIHLCKQNSLMNYRPALGHPRWMVDKTTALDITFMAIKYGRVHFPSDPVFRKEFTPDLLSPYEEVADSGEFAHRRFVRDPARPDDFAMALCFGLMAAMKLQHSDIMELIPRNELPAKTGRPEFVSVDPAEIMQALNG